MANNYTSVLYDMYGYSLLDLPRLLHPHQPGFLPYLLHPCPSLWAPRWYLHARSSGQPRNLCQVSGSGGSLCIRHMFVRVVHSLCHHVG
jgi:hypothetical protein